MRLKSIEFTENEGTPQEWTLEGLTLGDRNLIVGKNASGKTRTLNIISALAHFLSGSRQIQPNSTSKYNCHFANNGSDYSYQLNFKDGQVLTEILTIDGTVRLNRRAGGEGDIYYEQIDNGITAPFESPPSEITVATRRDLKQHKFLEPLYAWASSLLHYYFGTLLGKDHFAVIVPQAAIKLNDKDQNAVVGLYRQANKEFGEKFTKAVIDDLAIVDYRLTSIDVSTPLSISVVGTIGELVGINVKENDLPGITDQHSMSQGMFRALSLLINFNYFQLKKTATCILIDDIGEGLDFNRSCRLIDLLRRKAEASDIQIVMTTNDRFVMNQVPLEEWSVLQRKGNHVQVRNYSNSRKTFEEFKFTGLSNFSFLELDFINEPQSD
jgi:energy-coupling factor transporter ATP-binding protein EcfA2